MSEYEIFKSNLKRVTRLLRLYKELKEGEYKKGKVMRKKIYAVVILLLLASCTQRSDSFVSTEGIEVIILLKLKVN